MSSGKGSYLNSIHLLLHNQRKLYKICNQHIKLMKRKNKFSYSVAVHAVFATDTTCSVEPIKFLRGNITPHHAGQSLSSLQTSTIQERHPVGSRKETTRPQVLKFRTETSRPIQRSAWPSGVVMGINTTTSALLYKHAFTARR